MTYIESLRKTRELPAEIVLPGHGEPITDHVSLIDERLEFHRRRAEKIYGLIAEQSRNGYELAQALFGNVAVTQAYLTLSEVLGHVDLLLEDSGRVRPTRGEEWCTSRRMTSGVAKTEPRMTLPAPAEKARMLLIVNPKATTVSNRLKNLIVYALRARYEVEAVETEDRNHATELARHAADDGYDIVVAFGGDGTVNETANGLAGHRGAAFGAPRRLHERRLPDARHPHRRRRRERAPACAG